MDSIVLVGRRVEIVTAVMATAATVALTGLDRLLACRFA